MQSKSLLRLLGVLPVVLLLAQRHALAAETLTWDECVTQALEHNPDLVAARARVSQAQAGVTIAASGLSPQLTVAATNRTSQHGGATRTDAYSYTLSGTRLLYNGQRTRYDVRSAAADVVVAQYNYQVASATARNQLETAFVALLKAQQLVAITAQIEKRRKDNVDQVALRYQAGGEDRGALLTSRANLAEAQYEVQQAKRRLRLAQEQLAKALGREQLTNLTAQGELTVHDYSKDTVDLDALAADTPFFKSFQAAEEAARFNLRSARAAYYPEVSINASVGTDDSQWPPTTSEWSAGLSISVPLSQGGLRRAQISQAQAALNLAGAQTTSGYSTRLLALQQAWADLVDAVENIAVQRQFLDAAQERSSIANVEYANGLLTFNDWTIIEDAYINAIKAYLNAQAAAGTTEATWLEATGKTLEE